MDTDMEALIVGEKKLVTKGEGPIKEDVYRPIEDVQQVTVKQQQEGLSETQTGGDSSSSGL